MRTDTTDLGTIISNFDGFLSSPIATTTAKYITLHMIHSNINLRCFSNEIRQLGHTFCFPLFSESEWNKSETVACKIQKSSDQKFLN